MFPVVSRILPRRVLGYFLVPARRPRALPPTRDRRERGPERSSTSYELQRAAGLDPAASAALQRQHAQHASGECSLGLKKGEKRFFAGKAREIDAACPPARPSRARAPASNGADRPSARDSLPSHRLPPPLLAPSLPLTQGMYHPSMAGYPYAATMGGAPMSPQAMQGMMYGPGGSPSSPGYVDYESIYREMQLRMYAAQQQQQQQQQSARAHQGVFRGQGV